MIDFAIRDDDVCYWTEVEDLEKIYGTLWRENLKVSFSVIPFTVRSYNLGSINEFYQDNIQYPIHKNRELVAYLKDKIKNNLVSIMLHGVTHQYKIKRGKEVLLATKENMERMRERKSEKNKNWKLIGEFRWKSVEEMVEGIERGKKYLESIFGKEIKIFVPPSNDISKEGIRAIEEKGLNLSGEIVIRELNRPIDLYVIKNILLKLIVGKLLYKGKYPYLMNYKRHKELGTYGLVPSLSVEQLENYKKIIKKYGVDKRKKILFVLSVHYWELIKNKKLYNHFKDIIEMTKGNMVEYRLMEDLFD